MIPFEFGFVYMVETVFFFFLLKLVKILSVIIIGFKGNFRQRITILVIQIRCLKLDMARNTFVILHICVYQCD